jgi:alanine racemase
LKTATLDACLTIDLDALAQNLAQIRADVGGAEVAPVVKADGYGLGAGPVSRRLWAEGARRFFVARIAEGEALRVQLGERPAQILVLDGLTTGGAERLLAANLTPVLNSLDELDAWAAPGRSAVLHIDTGMNRLGLAPECVPEAAARIAAAGLRLEFVMSHLAGAGDPSDPRSARQLAAFEAVRAQFPGVPASLSASAGIYLDPAYHFDIVRPGICLFGGGPRDRPDPRFGAVATLTAPVLQVNTIEAGETAGYGPMFTASRATTIAMVAAGYADGLPRGSHRRAIACIGGRRAPYVIVTMDMIGLDVTDIGPVVPGDVVELLGPNVQLDDVAAAADGVVAHEILVRLSRRVARRYLGGD